MYKINVAWTQRYYNSWLSQYQTKSSESRNLDLNVTRRIKRVKWIVPIQARFVEISLLKWMCQLSISSNILKYILMVGFREIENKNEESFIVSACFFKEDKHSTCGRLKKVCVW